jgi:carbamoyltransferase
VLGFNLSHDSAACLVEDGVVRAALALERTTRTRRGTVALHAYAGAMADLTRDLLDSAGLDAADVDYWVGSSTETADSADESRLLDLLGLMVPAGQRLALPHPGHHLAHASAAFYTSGFDTAAALVVDAYGSRFGGGRERESGFVFRHGDTPQTVLRTLRPALRIAGQLDNGELRLPGNLEGVGELYRVVTLALGFRESRTVYDDAGKTMGLASYGKRLSADNLFVETGPGGLDFARAADSLVELGLAVREAAGLRLTGRRPGESLTQFHYDLAAQIQLEFEDACLYLVNEVLRLASSRSLVLSGGCFLNSKLNARIVQELDLDRFFVFPAATDDGNAVGAALYAYHHLTPESARTQPAPRAALKHVYLGPDRLGTEDIGALAKRWQLQLVDHGDQGSVTTAAAAAIARGDIVGWYGSRAELGPRALGARSILCHPGLPGMKDRLNARVKFREAFRPFAGSILAERADDWFEMPAGESPFMLLVCPVRQDRAEAVKEIVHVDGTCRVQTVDRDTPGNFRALIEAMERETGLPVVLNTSFNLRNMPIVERPDEAIDCLYGSRLDRIFIGTFELEGPDFHSLRPRILHARTPTDVILDPSVAELVRVRGKDFIVELLTATDGLRTVEEIASYVAADAEPVVDLLLELRRLGVVDWVGLPDPVGPVLALQQYRPLETEQGHMP